jgi:hypothetical protein
MQVNDDDIDFDEVADEDEDDQADRQEEYSGDAINLDAIDNELKDDQ